MPEFHFALITPARWVTAPSSTLRPRRGRANTELGLSGQIIETNSIAEQETAIGRPGPGQ
jgi:hypothetical protein